MSSRADIGAGAVLGVFLLAMALAVFVAGIVAIILIKYYYPKLQDASRQEALLQSIFVAAIATFVIYLGSLVGAAFSDFLRLGQSINYHAGAPFSEFAQRMFSNFALPFFLEILFSLFAAHFLATHSAITEKAQKIMIPIAAFLIFTVINTVWLLWMSGELLILLTDPIGFISWLIQRAMQSIIFPIEILVRSIWEGDIFYVFRITNGNQFVMAETLFPPALFFIAIGSLMTTILMWRKRRS